MEVLKKHFEGVDDSKFDEKVWEKYRSNLAGQKLPKFATYDNNYPKSSNGGLMNAQDVFNLIGGELKNPNFKNACAARASLALNQSGINIPKIKQVTFKGDDLKYYFVGARNMFEWLKKEIGQPTISLNHVQTKTDGSGFIKSTNKRKGIYVMIPNYPAQFGASGHVDIFYGNSFNGEGYFSPEGGLHRTHFWVLE
jgi:hypothetical protein